MTPRVSIVMPCHNGLAYLPRSIASVRAQRMQAWELIIVDDGSTDASAEWITAQEDARIRLLRQPHKGTSSARNRGLEHVKSDYVAFLDTDDTWAPTFLEKLTVALDANPQAVLAYCGWQKIGLPDPKGLPFVPPDYETPDKQRVLFAHCRWPIHAALARTAPMQATGGFPTHLQNAEDYVVWLELAARSPIVRVPEVLACYHIHSPTQASAQRARAALQLLTAQLEYLDRHPDFARSLGKDQRTIPYQGLLSAGFEAYWARDLATARILFRRVMQAGFGPPSDWAYMLPALLPFALHAASLRLLDSWRTGRRRRGP